MATPSNDKHQPGDTTPQSSSDGRSPYPLLPNGGRDDVAINVDGNNQKRRKKAKEEVKVFVTWKDVTVTVSDDNGERRPILLENAGYAEPGKVLAILGPSGGGKSTLLDALAGRLPLEVALSGSIKINKKPRSSLPFGVSAYVTQQDMLLETLTIKEAVYYSAELQLPNDMSKEEKRRKADEIITKMGLQMNADTTIGGLASRGISGGQKRRLSICLEILTDPQLIFLDEPTSGLDSAASLHVMSSIVSLAHDLERTVVLSVHQPSSEVFELFDELCLLAYGKTVYFGPASLIEKHFRENGYPCPLLMNPADHYLRIINKDFEKEKPSINSNRGSALGSCHSSKIQKRNQAAETPIEENAESSCDKNLSKNISQEINGLIMSFDTGLRQRVQKQVDEICQQNEGSGDRCLSENINKDIGTLLESCIFYLQQQVVKVVSKITGMDEEANTSHGISININDAIDKLVESYNSSLRMQVHDRVATISEKSLGQPQMRSRAGFVHQCLVLTRRSSLNMWRDMGYYWLRFGIYLAIAFCLGTGFYKLDISYPTIRDRSSVLQFLGGYLTFMTIGGFPSFVEDVKIFQRERLNGHYGVLVYVIAHTLSSAPFLIFVSVIPGVITYFMVGLQRSFTQFFYFLLVLYMLMTIVESLMMMIASVIPNFLYGIILGAGVQGIMMLNSGFFRLPDDIPKPVWKFPIHYIAFHKYGGQGFFKNEFFGLTFPNRERSLPRLLSGLQIVRDLYQMEVSYSKWIDLLALVGMVVVYRFLFFIIHKSKERLVPSMRAVGRHVLKRLLRQKSSAHRRRPAAPTTWTE